VVVYQLQHLQGSWGQSLRKPVDSNRCLHRARMRLHRSPAVAESTVMASSQDRRISECVVRDGCMLQQYTVGLL
jgi:hypothetical protein